MHLGLNAKLGVSSITCSFSASKGLVIPMNPEKFALHVDIFVVLEKNWLVHVSAIEDPTCVPFHAIFIFRLEMQKKNCAYDDM